MDLDAKIYVAGHRGLVGSAICRLLASSGYTNIVTRSRDQLDLRDQSQVAGFFHATRPDYVMLAAARVGGIMANREMPGDFICDNLFIQNNVIHASYVTSVKRLLFLGSSCIYPRECPQPITESMIMTGPLEPTNEPYAMAKLAGMSMIAAYRRQYGFDAVALMPTNLYGPHDNFDEDTSHLVPALMGKMHRAKLAGDASVAVWGTGSPRRELMHVDDLAHACLHFMHGPAVDSIVNVGTGHDMTIAEIARAVQGVVGYEGELCFDTSKPDGTPRKVLDVTRAHSLGWRAGIYLSSGLRDTYEWFLTQRPGAGHGEQR